jgi:hypothetical protein
LPLYQIQNNDGDVLNNIMGPRAEFLNFGELRAQIQDNWKGCTPLRVVVHCKNKAERWQSASPICKGVIAVLVVVKKSESVYTFAVSIYVKKKAVNFKAALCVICFDFELQFLTGLYVEAPTTVVRVWGSQQKPINQHRSQFCLAVHIQDLTIEGESSPVRTYNVLSSTSDNLPNKSLKLSR